MYQIFVWPKNQISERKLIVTHSPQILVFDFDRFKYLRLRSNQILLTINPTHDSDALACVNHANNSPTTLDF